MRAEVYQELNPGQLGAIEPTPNLRWKDGVLEQLVIHKWYAPGGREKRSEPTWRPVPGAETAQLPHQQTSPSVNETGDK